MSSTLYRKYRPKNFSEVVGQDHIVHTLSNAIKNNRVSQAYLFTGSRGTGKTSFARILAKTANCSALTSSSNQFCVSCEKCANCQLINDNRALDIIEIDAASNTGVDNIRELRETVNLPSTQLKYKVYIIDEVHMLSPGAFNALLKTLEEPPKHVIFILATTEIHKVPATIISRCQRFDFSKFSLSDIIKKLSRIAKQEKISINPEALEMIALASEGGMRDAESLLGQIISLEDKKITAQEVATILGTANKNISAKLVDLLLQKNTAELITEINSLSDNGYDLQVFIKSFLNYLRQLMLIKVDASLGKKLSQELTEEQLKKMADQVARIELPEIISTIHIFIDAQEKISSFALPQLPLEIAAIRATRTFPPLSDIYSRQKIETEIVLPEESFSEPDQSKDFSQNESLSEKTEPNEIITAALPDGDIDLYTIRQNWKSFLEEMKKQNPSLAAILSSDCRAIEVSNNVLILSTPYDFYKEKLNNPQDKLTVENVFGRILELKIRIKVVTHKEAGIEIKSNQAIFQEKDSTEASQTQTLLDEHSAEKNSDIDLLNSAMEIMGAKVMDK